MPIISKRKRLTTRKHLTKRKREKKGDFLKSKLNNIKEQEAKLKHHESWKLASSSSKPNVATEPTILGRINIISERKGDINFPSVENSATSLNENEDIAHHQPDLQHSIKKDREQEKHIKSYTLEVDDFISCLDNSENDQPIFIDVDNKKDYIADQHCVNASQNTKEKQIQEIKSESLEKCTSYLENNKEDYITGQHYGNASDNAKERRIQEEKKSTENNLQNNENAKELQNNHLINNDAVDLLFLGLAESVKSFSAERQANIKLKIVNLVLEQEVQQRKEDSKLSRSLGESLM